MVMQYPAISRANIPVSLPRDGVFKLLPTQAGWTETNVGTGDTTVFGESGMYQVVPANGDTTLVTLNLMGLEAGSAYTNPTRINWDKKLYFGGHCSREASTANLIARIQVKGATTIGALGTKGFGLQITNYTMIGESYGSSLSTTGTLQTMVSRTTYDFMVVHTPGVSVQYYINGTLIATTTTAAGIPSVEGAATGAVAVSFNNASGGAAASREFWSGGFWIYQPR